MRRSRRPRTQCSGSASRSRGRRPARSRSTMQPSTARPGLERTTPRRAAPSPSALARLTKTIDVAVLDDAHDEGSETLTLVLSNPSGAYLADGEATGTITNSDHMPAAWLSRFGRTVAEQVVDAARSRLAGAPVPGANVQIAGYSLTPGGNLNVLEPDESSFGERNITGRDLLTGARSRSAPGPETGAPRGSGAGVCCPGSPAPRKTSRSTGRHLTDPRRRLGAGALHARGNGVPYPGHGKLPGSGRRARGERSDGTLPLWTARHEQPSQPVGSRRVRGGHALAHAGRTALARDRHRSGHGGRRGAKRAPRGDRRRRARARRSDRCHGRPDELGRSAGQRGRQPRRGEKRK